MFRVGKEKHITDLLSSYLDGRLTARERAQVEEHLAACPACSADLESLRATVHAVRALPTVAVPRSFYVQPAPQPRPAYVLLRLATATVAAMLVLTMAGDLFLRVYQPAMAPAPEALATMPAVAATDRRELAAPASPAPAPSLLASPPPPTAEEKASEAATAPASASTGQPAAPTQTAPARPAIEAAPTLTKPGEPIYGIKLAPTATLTLPVPATPTPPAGAGAPPAPLTVTQTRTKLPHTPTPPATATRTAPTASPSPTAVPSAPPAAAVQAIEPGPTPVTAPSLLGLDETTLRWIEGGLVALLAVLAAATVVVRRLTQPPSRLP